MPNINVFVLAPVAVQTATQTNILTGLNVAVLSPGAEQLNFQLADNAAAQQASQLGIFGGTVPH